MVTTIPVGERCTTILRQRAIVAVEHINPDGPRGGQIRWRYADEFYDRRRFSYRNWSKYQKATTNA